MMLLKILKRIKRIYIILLGSAQAKRVQPWFKINGDKTLRLDYDLQSTSIVFDLGGYEGQFASDIFSKYCCTIYVFEPVSEFSDNIKRRFERNPNIQTYSFGLADKSSKIMIGLSQDGSSVFKKKKSGFEEIELVEFKAFIDENSIESIDLIKINIEGGEYDLIEHLLSTDLIKKIKNIQIQFHDFVPNSKNRMKDIQNKLSDTHEPTYMYEFVWENWRLKSESVV